MHVIRSQRALLAIVMVGAFSLLATPHASAADQSSGQTSDQHVQGEFIVKLKGSATSMSSSAFMGKARAQGRMHLKRSWSGINTHHYVMSSEAEAQAKIAELKADPAVEYVEPNYILSLSNTETSSPAVHANDSNTASTSDHDNCTMNNGQTASGIDISGAWNQISNNGQLPIVAVVDTGISLTHPTFVQTGAVWTNAGETGTDANGHNKQSNGVDDDGNGYIDDYRGWNFVSNTNNPQDDNEHGTHVSGIILGTTQDIITPARGSGSLRAAAIRIMPLKFLDSTGQGTTANGITAIYYAVANHAKVINASWGGSSFSNGLLDAIAYAYNNGVTVVTAAGNAGTNNDSSPTYPANYGVPSQLSVAASYDSDDSLAYFSNFGSSTVHVAGPGYWILSTLPNGSSTSLTDVNNYGCLSGTSMATPFVSGIAALIYHESPNMTGYQVRNLIMTTVDAKTVLNQKVATTGRVNANTAVVQAKTATVDTSQPDYSASSFERSTASAAAGGGCGRVQAFDQTSGTGKSLEFFALLAVLALPILVNRYVRSRYADDDGRNRRRHERFNIESEVRMNVGGRELKGSISTISLGGVQLNADALLEQGGIVTMMISSPDGKEQIKVEGQVVWSAESKAYGVQFAKAEDGALASIGEWTKNLTKAS